MTNIKERMTTKNAKTILFASLIAAMIIPLTTMGFVFAAPNENANEQTSLTTYEKMVIPQSIKSYDVNQLKPIDVRNKIANNEVITVSYKELDYDLLVQEYDLKSPTAKAYRTIDGVKTEVPLEDVKTYIGKVTDERNSDVRLVVSENAVAGFIKIDDKELAIEPLSFRDPTLANDKQIIYGLEDLEFEFSMDNDVEFGIEETQEEELPIGVNWFSESMFPEANASGQHYADVITDCDEDYYDLGTSNWQSRQLTVISGTNMAYSDTDVLMSVAQFNCQVATLDEYTIGDNWDALEEYWDGEADSRDLVFGFLGNEFDYNDLGTAKYIGGVSDTASKAYAVAQMVADDDDGSKYNASSLEQKILVAHEIGHVLGAQHNNNQIGGQYTIMTNQSFLEDDVDLEFHSTSVSQINPYAHSYT